MLKVDHTKSYLTTKNVRGAYPRRGVNLREGAYQNLESEGGASLREGAKPNKYGILNSDIASK